MPVWSSHLCQGNVHNITAIVLSYSGIPHGHAEESGIDTAKFPALWKRFGVNGIILHQAQRMVFWILHDLTNPKQKEHQIIRHYGFLRQIRLNQSIIYQLHSKWSVFSFKDYIYIYPDPKITIIEWKCTYSHNFPFGVDEWSMDFGCVTGAKTIVRIFAKLGSQKILWIFFGTSRGFANQFKLQHYATVWTGDLRPLHDSIRGVRRALKRDTPLGQNISSWEAWFPIDCSIGRFMLWRNHFEPCCDQHFGIPMNLKRLT